MASMNKVFLIGNLGKDSELTFFGEGRAKLSFSLATNENYKDREGQWQKSTVWHRIVAWGSMAQEKHEILKKGKQILVEGRIKNRQYTTPDGAQRSITEVTADRVLLLERRPHDGEASGHAMSEPEPEPVPESDVPF